MRVELPNGVIIDGVPEGTSKHMIATKAIKNGLAKPEDFGYEGAPSAASESGMENFLAGVGSGLVNTGRRAANLLQLDHLGADWASDEAIAEQEKLDEDLLETKAGLGGKITGEIAGTYPIGGVVGKGAGVLGRALRGKSMVPKYLPNTLQRGAGRAAVEGATIGGVLADPGQRLEGATSGAAFGGALGGAGTVLGKALGKGTLIPITKEARHLQKMTGTFIPLSQSAKQGLGKQVYNALLANFPGLGGKLRGQYRVALDDLRRFVGEHAHPPRADVVIDASDDVYTMMGKLDSAWKKAFDPIKKVRFKPEAVPVMPNFLVKRLKGYIDEGTLTIPKAGKPLSGDDILVLKNSINDIFDNLNPRGQEIASKYLKSLDALLKKHADADLWADYVQAQAYWPVWRTLRKAVESADDKIFKPSKMGRAVKAGSDDLLDAPRAGMLSKEALEDFPSKQGLFQTAAAMGLAGGVGTATVGAAPTAAILLGTYGIGRAMLTKTLQKYLSGQLKTQHFNKAMMRRFSKELQRLGMTARDAAIVLGENSGS